MAEGIIFDIKEFAVHDGPGIRTTVFMKGCPLRCTWCHNPEGLLRDPQYIHSDSGTRKIGQIWQAEKLADYMLRQSDFLSGAGGGITFSGGEPLEQAEFISEVIQKINGMNIVLDTSGYAPEEDFKDLVNRCSLVLFDLKLLDSVSHKKFTGKPNELILKNLHTLDGLGIPFKIRIPLIPGLTDTTGNLCAAAELIGALKSAPEVELLPYNRFAGGKYKSAGIVFNPGYDENIEVNCDLSCFLNNNIKARIV
ncbi:radical SAM protein [Marispirochaeta aestuarii]|uniref:radical SAM protein n=1 Tax=Marispirochaeta aestuarii TaxID=1963862 RepID=UPI0029C81282|nr:radical SAM protein [Marispirochaeta aestuarii]